MLMIKILSLDGGGTRGLITLRVLEALEKRVGLPIRDMFDMIGGVSIGGIISCMLTHPLKTFNYSNDFFIEDARKAGIDLALLEACFGTPRKWYQPPRPNLLFTKYKDRVPVMKKFYEESMVGDQNFGVNSAKPCMVFSYDLTQSALKVFKSWREGSQQYPLSTVMMATSAATTYFPAVQFGNEKLVDGGVVSTDPSVMISYEARRLLNNYDDPILLVSLGTTVQGLNDFDGLAHAGNLRVVPKIIDLLFETSLRTMQYLNGRDGSPELPPTKTELPDSSFETVGQHQEGHAFFRKTPEMYYYRLMPSVNVPLDSTAPHNLLKFEKIAQSFDDESLIMDHLVKHLKTTLAPSSKGLEQP